MMLEPQRQALGVYGVRIMVVGSGLSLGCLSTSPTQRAQYPLVKGYSLNHNLKPLLV